MLLKFSIANSFQNALRNFILLCAIVHSFSIYIPPGPRYVCPASKDKVNLLYPCVCERGSDEGLYVTCENAALATISVGLGNLASLRMPVERLVINQCKIANLYGPLLYRSVVRILIINDTPIQKIDHNTFFGVNRTLQELYLINTKLDAFPAEAFKILGNLTILKIDKHNIQTIDKDIFTKSMAAGHLQRLHITNGLISSVPIEAFQGLNKLKTLDLHGNKLTSLVKNQFKGLREVELLDISHNNLTKLEGQHIADMTKLGWCNASHNSIGEMSRGMFARNALLKWLSLENNKIKKLDTNSFRGMRFLRRLFMADNEIHDIGRSTFSSVTRIGTIDLARNKLQKVDFKMFYELNYVEVIDVSENQITMVDKESFKDLYLTTINMSRNAISRIEPDAFINCNNITVLDLSFNNISQINARVFDQNTYTFELQLSYNHLTSLDQVPIEHMAGIRILNVSNNAIKTIPRKAFPKLYELHTIDVSHNNLSEIAPSVFQVLFSLRFLNLSYNSMVHIKAATFGNLPTLLDINLSHNQLRDVSRGSLANLASCRTLDISNNHLERLFQLPISLGELNFSNNNLSTIPANTWPSMNALLVLNLRNNSLGDNLDGNSFNSLLTLRTLDLSSNGITLPPWEALSKLSSLQYLYLRDNRIQKLGKGAFGNLPVVFEVDLTNNQIDSVEKLTFTGLLQLLTLSMRNNSLTRLPMETFKGLVSLRSLDLSQNFLEQLDNKTNGVLDDCLSLERVNLSYNKFSFITKKFFPNNPWIPYKLNNVDLSYNAVPVITKDVVLGAKKLHVFNLSHNIINDIREDVIGNLTSLQILDLSYNQLEDIAKNKAVFNLPPNITSINLSNNRLSYLPIEKLNKAAKLSKLDVSDNVIEELDDDIIAKIINDNLQVKFHGNPLRCDCFIRPLKHYLNHLSTSQQVSEDMYSNLECVEPAPLKGMNLSNLDDDRLLCLGSVAMSVRIEAKLANGRGAEYRFDVEPDLAFRDVQFSQESIYADWYVVSSRDVADFRVIVRDDRNNLYYMNNLPYTARTVQINVGEQQKLKDALFKAAPERLELCVMAESSATKTVNWFGSQCKMLPGNFELLPKKLKPNRRTSSDVYVERKFGSSVASCVQSSNSLVVTFAAISMVLRELAIYTQGDSLLSS